MSVSMLEHFSVLKDPRIERHKLHQLEDILVLTVCAVAAGADGWEAIAEFGQTKLDWLRRYVPLENGVPSHDCIAYVISRLSPKGFQECFRRWTQAASSATQGEIIAIDGKTARGSRDRVNERKPLHMVSAWANRNRLVLGQQACEEKSNEITAIPRLLELLDLKGCIVTIDAMGCQHQIADQIVEQGGDYVLGLKGNQSTLHEAVEDFFTVAREAEFSNVHHSYTEEIDKDHGRTEIRRYWISDELRSLPNVSQWRGLHSIGMVERECWEGECHTIEQRYFLGSIPPVAPRFKEAVREHWGIENRLHWRLDVLFGDDASRIRTGNAPQIMTTLRHLCLNLFEQEPSKLSMAKKRRKAAWDDNYRAKVVFG